MTPSHYTKRPNSNPYRTVPLLNHQIIQIVTRPKPSRHKTHCYLVLRFAMMTKPMCMIRILPKVIEVVTYGTPSCSKLRNQRPHWSRTSIHSIRYHRHRRNNKSFCGILKPTMMTMYRVARTNNCTTLKVSIMKWSPMNTLIVIPKTITTIVDASPRNEVTSMIPWIHFVAHYRPGLLLTQHLLLLTTIPTRTMARTIPMLQKQHNQQLPQSQTMHRPSLLAPRHQYPDSCVVGVPTVTCYQPTIIPSQS